MACGTPVIALRRGGAAENVAGLDTAEPTGVFFEEQTAQAVAAAVRSFEQSAAAYSPPPAAAVRKASPRRAFAPNSWRLSRDAMRTGAPASRAAAGPA